MALAEHFEINQCFAVRAPRAVPDPDWHDSAFSVRRPWWRRLWPVRLGRG